MNPHDNTFLTQSQSVDSSKRLHVATDPACPGEVLCHLVTDPVEEVAEQAVANPSMPPAVMERLLEIAAKDDDSRASALLWRVARSANSPVGLADRLLGATFLEDPHGDMKLAFPMKPFQFPLNAMKMLSDPGCPTEWISLSR